MGDIPYQDFASSCVHEDIDVDGCCKLCGLSCNRLIYGPKSNAKVFTNSHSLVKRAERSIAADLAKIDITEQIKQRTELIWNLLDDGTSRGNRRIMKIFYCVYHAHREEGVIELQSVVAKKVGLDSKDINKALSAFSGSKTGYRPTSKKLSPIDYIPAFCRALKFPEEVQASIIKLAQSIIQKEPALEENTPQKIAGGIVYYYMVVSGLKSVNNVPITIQDISELASLSDATIKNTFQEISIIDNS